MACETHKCIAVHMDFNRKNIIVVEVQKAVVSKATCKIDFRFSIYVQQVRRVGQAADGHAPPVRVERLADGKVVVHYGVASADEGRVLLRHRDSVGPALLERRSMDVCLARQDDSPGGWGFAFGSAAAGARILSVNISLLTFACVGVMFEVV